MRAVRAVANLAIRDEQMAPPLLRIWVVVARVQQRRRKTRTLDVTVEAPGDRTSSVKNVTMAAAGAVKDPTFDATAGQRLEFHRRAGKIEFRT